MEYPMKINTLTLVFALSFFLTACGGSGGGNSNGGGGDGPSNTGSNSETVFGDNLNPSWGKFNAYEWSGASGSGKNYDDGQTTNFLQWKIVQATSSEHASVIEVSYAQQDDRWAQFYVVPTATKTTDLSRFETGKFSFDINVIDWGAAYDSTTGTGTFEVRVECGWPCASHAFNVVIGKSNEWQHVEINVADFASSGADLTKLDGTFLIKPIIGKQKGTRYQLDNIKWTKGSTAAAKKKIIFEEHFNTYASKNDWVFVPVNSTMNAAQSFISDGLLIATSANSTSYTDWAIEKTLDQTINIDHKNINFQINPDISLKGFSNLELVATDSSGYTAYTRGIYLDATFKANAWNQVSFNVDNAGVVADNLFNPAMVKKLKFVFHANGQPFTFTSGTGWLEIDEYIITE
jgi:hypothetical protein